MINPITGHRLSLSQDFEHYYAVAKQCYASMGHAIQTELISFVKQRRLIRNTGQLDYLGKRLEQPEYQEILHDFDESPTEFHNPQIGSIGVNSSAVVDCKQLLDSVSVWLEQHSALRKMKVNYQDLKNEGQHIALGEIRAKAVIFCEGAAAIANPWLNHLPFKLAKGEILSLKLEQDYDGRLLNWGDWMAPSSSSQVVKLGSSYEWNDLDLTTSEETAEKLLTSLHENTHFSGEVIEHQAGIRPASKDRRPFIGAMQNLNNAYCFNGFGSKGCLIIPFYAQLLCDHLINDTAISRELTKWL